jgi:hypothetical protein
MPHRNIQEIHKWMLIGACRTNRLILVQNIIKSTNKSELVLDHPACAAICTNNVHLYFALVGLGAKDFEFHKKVSCQIPGRKLHDTITHFTRINESLKTLHQNTIQEISKLLSTITKTLLNFGLSEDDFDGIKGMNTQPEDVAKQTSDHHITLAVESLCEALFLPFVKELKLT